MSEPRDGYRDLPRLFAKYFADATVTGMTGGKVWVYSPPVYRDRGKRFSYRNRLRRARFNGSIPPQFTFEPEA